MCVCVCVIVLSGELLSFSDSNDPSDIDVEHFLPSTAEDVFLLYYFLLYKYVCFILKGFPSER